MNSNPTCPLCGEADLEIADLGNTRVFKCQTCSLQFVEEKAFDPKHFDDYYDRYRKSNIELNALREEQYKLDALHLHSYVANGAILDVGCSTGRFLECVNALGNYTLHGIDPDLGAIDLARSHHRTDNFLFEPLHLDSLETRREYDAIVFRGTLQYLGGRLRPALDNLAKLVKKGSFLFIYSLPNSDSFLYYLLKEKWHLFNPVEHRLIFNKRSIEFLQARLNAKLAELSYPYQETVYANLNQDYEKVVNIIKSGTSGSTAFWGNMIQAVIRFEN